MYFYTLNSIPSYIYLIFSELLCRPFSAPGDHGIVVDVINSSGEVGRTPHDLNCHTDDVESGEQQN